MSEKRSRNQLFMVQLRHKPDVMRTPIHEFKDTTGIALSKYGSDVSLGLCQVQVSNAILLDMGLNPE